MGLLRFTRTIDDSAVFNVTVLIGSLISTVVVAFTIIMRTLEEYCRISTSEPNKHVIGDQALTTASAESARAADKASGGASGNGSAVAASVSGFNEASSGYADFDSGSGRDADDTDDGRVHGALPFHGNVIFQARGGGECEIEMQSVPKLPPSMSAAPTGVVMSLPHGHDQQQQQQQHGGSVGVDLNAQMVAMLTSMQREMRALAERSESQHARVESQYERSESQAARFESHVARSEAQMASLVGDYGELAALKDDMTRQFDLQDQKINSALMACAPPVVDS